MEGCASQRGEKAESLTAQMLNSRCRWPRKGTTQACITCVCGMGDGVETGANEHNRTKEVSAHEKPLTCWISVRYLAILSLSAMV